MHVSVTCQRNVLRHWRICSDCYQRYTTSGCCRHRGICLLPDDRVHRKFQSEVPFIAHLRHSVCKRFSNSSLTNRSIHWNTLILLWRVSFLHSCERPFSHRCRVLFIVRATRICRRWNLLTVMIESALTPAALKASFDDNNKNAACLRVFCSTWENWPPPPPPFNVSCTDEYWLDSLRTVLSYQEVSKRASYSIVRPLLGNILARLRHSSSSVQFKRIRSSDFSSSFCKLKLQALVGTVKKYLLSNLLFYRS